MEPEMRRFPRVHCRLPGEMFVRRPNRGPGTELECVGLPVTILSMTCEGVGIEIRGRDRPVMERGTPLVLRFDIGEHVMELPGAVAWYREHRDTARPCDLGVRLRMDYARSDSTRAYAAWIVDLLAQRMNREMELGVVLLQVAHLSLDTLQVALARRKQTWRPVGEVLIEMNAITKHELRIAESCELPCAGQSVPASLLEWQRSLECTASSNRR